jgi:hypothetical protein
MQFLEELLDDDTKEDVVAAFKEGVSDRYIYNCNYTDYFDARLLTAHAIRSSCYPSYSHNFGYNPQNSTSSVYLTIIDTDSLTVQWNPNMDFTRA